MKRDLTRLLHAQRHAVGNAPFPTLTSRRERLARLARMTKHHQRDIIHAIQTDFGKRSETEIRLAEISAVLQAIRHTRRHLWHWMRPYAANMPWRLWPARARIVPQPLGVVGIMSPWNYPWSLALMPAIDAFAAGNSVMIKPSEFAPTTSALLAKLVPQYFTDEELCIVEGGPEIAKAFSALPFDHLVFTGSTRVGRQVALAAAEQLTPVTLELGGKSPAIVASDADLDRAAASIIFGKGMNAGQTCIAPDYVLVESRHLEALIQALSRAIKQQRPSDKEATGFVSPHHQQRSERLIEQARDHGCRIIDTGHHAPALVIDPTQNLELMSEEIFGRALPLISVKTLDDAIAFVNARPHPLALYAFTDNKLLQTTLRHTTRSGALVFNETLLHHAVPSLPFGGVGESGIGAYHGRHGFERFSHLRGIFYQSKRASSSLIRPPYKRWLLKLLRIG
ncbi:aldehyde dehydrogenase family protein [Vreelandella andesensis]|uniref:Aldehyde dehydrogenase n=1 Tax=Vreelandella andesensis TaxID=447567 RepID=A0A3S0VYR0_9GAMM|nr:aldehyde dehydrogenase family protein [Halomonas andesensis]RUR26743.1 aldehyde dehydrogenase family protein [Halomonas andesensis]